MQSKFKNYFLKTATLIVVLTLSVGCNNTEDDKQTSLLDTTNQLNFIDMYDNGLLSMDGNISLFLSPSKDNNLEESPKINVNALSRKLANILKTSMDPLVNESISRQISRDSGDMYTTDYTNYGSISGTKRTVIEMNTTSGSLYQEIIYTNFKNLESSLCGSTVEYMDGTMYYTSPDIEKSINVTVKSDFSTDTGIWKAGMSILLEYNSSSIYDEDTISTTTIEMVIGNDIVGVKGYKTRNYSDNGYEFRYIIEGDMYVSMNDIHGYYSIDETYNHSLTPLKEDYCGEYIYSGTEKYVGKDSSLTYTITSTNNYRIEVDGDNDGIIDINETHTVQN